MDISSGVNAGNKSTELEEVGSTYINFEFKHSKHGHLQKLSCQPEC